MKQLSGTPILDRIFILQSKGEDKVAGSIVIPDSERQKPCKGIVVAVGLGWITSTTGQLVPMIVKVGDTVIYNEHSATTVELDGVDYLCVKEGDLLYKF